MNLIIHQSKINWINEPGIPSEWRLERLRLYRDELLKETDFRVLEDVPWDKTLWINYRQQLRDLTLQFNGTGEVIFPNYPAY